MREWQRIPAMSTRNPAVKDLICIALDMDDRQEIFRCVDDLADLVGYFKVNAAFTRFGPQLVGDLLARGCKVFLDVKLHDIPNTVAAHVRAATALGVHIVTVHT